MKSQRRRSNHSGFRAQAVTTTHRGVALACAALLFVACGRSHAPQETRQPETAAARPVIEPSEQAKKEKRPPSEPPSSAPAPAVEEAAEMDAERSAGTFEAIPSKPKPARQAKPTPPKSKLGTAEAGSASGADRARMDAPADAEPTLVTPAMAFQQLEERYQALGEALSLTEPNCLAAQKLRDSICDLSERICRLEFGLPTSTEVRRCAQGRARCVQARADFDRKCN